MKVGDLVIHTPEKSSMRETYEALGDCTAQFHIGLIVDIKRTKKIGYGYACVSAATTKNLYWYSFDELEVVK